MSSVKDLWIFANQLKQGTIYWNHENGLAIIYVPGIDDWNNEELTCGIVPIDSNPNTYTDGKVSFPQLANVEQEKSIPLELAYKLVNETYGWIATDDLLCEIYRPIILERFANGFMSSNESMSSYICEYYSNLKDT